MIEHRTISLAEQVFDRLETDILSGKYQQGEILTELKLVADLGVSRTPIREALRRLEQEHIIEISQKGIVVLGVSRRDLEDILEIRMRIEGLAAYMAAQRITDEELDELKETVELQEFYVPKHDADRINGMDSKFHLLIYRFSGSTPLYDTLMPLHKKLLKYRKASVENEVRSAYSSQEHRAIFEAIAAHDAELAEQRMRAHISNAKAYIQNKDKGIK
ncbi:MAG: GntR family transcriptional regulator [Clostridia bacterium]|nr:GntR family transcriptional regulator [Clostridia bacterium]